MFARIKRAGIPSIVQISLCDEIREIIDHSQVMAPGDLPCSFPEVTFIIGPEGSKQDGFVCSSSPMVTLSPTLAMREKSRPCSFILGQINLSGDTGVAAR